MILIVAIPLSKLLFSRSWIWTREKGLFPKFRNSTMRQHLCLFSALSLYTLEKLYLWIYTFQDLRVTCFSSASCPPRGEWIRTPLVMRPPDQSLGYGLAAPRNGARSLLSAIQAHMIKWLLFDSRPQTKDNKCDVPPDTWVLRDI